MKKHPFQISNGGYNERQMMVGVHKTKLIARALLFISYKKESTLK
jgi:hypothetical protein